MAPTAFVALSLAFETPAHRSTVPRREVSFVIEIRVLGPVEIIVGDNTLAIGGRLARRLVAALAMRRDGMTTDHLVEVMWPSRAPVNPIGALHKHVWSVRRALEAAGVNAEAVLATVSDGYRLDVAADAIDAARFEALTAVASEALKRGEHAVAADALAAAQSLWRGPALGDVCDSDYGRAEAARLEEMRLACQEAAFESRLALGGGPELVAELQAIVAKHPYRERLHAHLMLALYRDGRQVDALAVYDDARRILRDELGLEPGHELRALEHAILDHDPSLAASSRRHHGNLPKPQHALVGRAEELATISRELDAGRLVTLLGVGGVGKTRLAIEAAAAHSGDFPDGAWLVPLSPVTSDSVPSAVADSLGIEHAPGSSIAEAVTRSLANRRVLLVLDTCEHVLPAVDALVLEFMRSCDHVVVLATSRERLRTSGERVVDIAPLAVPAGDHEDVEHPLDDDAAPALTLLLQRATQVRPGFRAEGSERRALVDITRRLEGLPLALELAAARLRSMSPSDLLARLDQPLGQLVVGSRSADARQQTLRATIDWSYSLLDDDERHAFEQLSVFAGGAAIDDIEVVCEQGAVRREAIDIVLGRLVEKSVVRASAMATGTMRYDLLDTIRQFGIECLADAGELSDRRDRHARHFARVATMVRDTIDGHDEMVGVATAHREFDNLRTAFRSALEACDLRTAMTIPAALRWYAHQHLRREVYAWADEALEAAAAAGIRGPDDVLASTFASAVTGAWMRGDLPRAKDLAEHAVASAATDGGRAEALNGTAMVAHFEGRLGDAIAIHREAIGLAEGAGQSYSAAAWKTPLAIATSFTGDTATATSVLDEQAAEFRAMNKPADGMSFALHLMARGEVLVEADPLRALEAHDRCIALGRRGVNRFVLGISLTSASSLRARHAAPADAIDPFIETIDYWRRSGNTTQQWITLRNVIELLDRLDMDRPAAMLFGAIAAAPKAPPPFGAAAERLDASRAAIETRLGHTAWAEATAEGARLNDEQVVAFARHALRSLR